MRAHETMNQAVNHDAVHTHVSGFKMVDYGEAVK